MKILMALAPIVMLLLIAFMHKKEGNVKKTVMGVMLLWVLATLAISGNIMRAVSPLFVAHIVALVISYFSLVYYVLTEKFIWFTLALPLLTMFIYLMFAWFGNEHLPSII